MKVLNQDDIETFEDYGTSGYPSVYQRIQYDKLVQKNAEYTELDELYNKYEI